MTSDEREGGVEPEMEEASGRRSGSPREGLGGGHRVRARGEARVRKEGTRTRVGSQGKQDRE